MRTSKSITHLLACCLVHVPLLVVFLIVNVMLPSYPTQLLIFFLIVNIFLAILNDAYIAVKVREDAVSVAWLQPLCMGLQPLCMGCSLCAWGCSLLAPWGCSLLAP